MLAQCRIPEVCAAATHDIVRAVRLQHVSVEFGLGERHVTTDVARQQGLRMCELVFLQLLFAIETLATLAENNSNDVPLEPRVRVSIKIQLLQESCTIATYTSRPLHSTLDHT